jgi:hypothetical protein
MGNYIGSDEFPPVCRRQVLPVNILTQMNYKSGCIGKFPACGQISFLKLNRMITDVVRKNRRANSPVIRVDWFQPGGICE